MMLTTLLQTPEYETDKTASAKITLEMHNDYYDVVFFPGIGCFKGAKPFQALL